MVLLVAGDKSGDKSGNWRRWYDMAIPLAEARYAEHLSAMGDDGWIWTLDSLLDSYT